ncbi:alpha/beta fold hydrolase [Thaumasiovibrio subtropicus]|uniref:alpha/beta fold hydrolase n=1 Tax=Thaumasiovibrio subtropicus TaxID=1891207 RepID=UPI000B3570C9|nr:alpha/beta hydrolase [Thaumasiovibrio subtropicus]
MNKFAFLLSAFLFFPLHAAEPTSTQGERTLTRADGSTLIYYLLPKQSRQLLILLQGSDCNSVSHNPKINGVFSSVIPDADLLLVEKYGVNRDLEWQTTSDREDCPASFVSNDSPDQRVRDIKLVLNQLESRYDSVILLGGSEGAVVAGMLAASEQRIDAVVALNAGGRFFIDDVLYNMQSTMPPQAYNDASKGFKGFANAVLSQASMDITSGIHGFRWWKSMLSTDQLDIYQQIDVPVLYLQAELDINVDPKKAHAMAEALNLDKPLFEYQVLAGLDHGLHDVNGADQSEQVVDKIRDWLRRLDIKTE